MIQTIDLYKSFGDLQVLKGINEHVAPREVISIIGPSGGGKSTFLRCLNMLETPDSGHIIFEGTDITSEKVDIDIHRQKMGMVFQQFNLFPNMTVLENLTCAPMMLKKIPKAEAEARGLHEKAEAMKQYGEAAKMDMQMEALKLYFEQLPAIAKAVGDGYQGVDKIVMLGNDAGQLAGNMMGNITQIIEGFRGATGVDPMSVLSGMLGAKIADKD